MHRGIVYILFHFDLLYSRCTYSTPLCLYPWGLLSFLLFGNRLCTLTYFLLCDYLYFYVCP